MVTSLELQRRGLRHGVIVDAAVTTASLADLERAGLCYFVEVDSSGNSVAPGGGAVGGAALLANETDGFAADFTYATDAQRIATKTAGVLVSSGVDAFYANAGTSPKMVWDSAGALVWAPHNLFLNSGVPATQTVTTIVGEIYTVTVTGSGSMALTSGGSGTASAGAPLTFTATGTSTICTITGSLTTIQMNRGSVATAYLVTTGTRRYAVAVDYDPVTLAGRGLLVEVPATNVVLYSSDFTQSAWTKSNMTTALTATGPTGAANTASTLTATAGNATALQALTSASQARSTACFIKRRSGSGNIDLTQDNGSTWTTQTVTSAWKRFELPVVTSLNPTVGIRLVTSGDAVDVAIFQHETSVISQAMTSPNPTFVGTIVRAADNYTFLLSQIPSLGSEYSIYVRFSTSNIANARYAVVVTDGTTSEFAGFQASTTLRLGVTDGGSAVGAITGPTIVAGTSLSVAGRFKLNDCAMSVNGAAVGVDTTVTMPTVTETRYGTTGANVVASGPFRIEKLVIVPRAWSDVELVAKSAT